jgi:hypothetical protein
MASLLGGLAWRQKAWRTHASPTPAPSDSRRLRQGATEKADFLRGLSENKVGDRTKVPRPHCAAVSHTKGSLSGAFAKIGVVVV